MVVGEEEELEEELEEVRIVGMVRWIVGRIGKRVGRMGSVQRQAVEVSAACLLINSGSNMCFPSKTLFDSPQIQPAENYLPTTSRSLKAACN